MLAPTQDLQRLVSRCDSHPAQEVTLVADLVPLPDRQDCDLLKDVLGQVVVAHNGPDVGQEPDPLAQQMDDQRLLLDGVAPSPCSRSLRVSNRTLPLAKGELEGVSSRPALAARNPPRSPLK